MEDKPSLSMSARYQHCCLHCTPKCLSLAELLAEQSHQQTLADATRLKKLQLQEMKSSTSEDLTKGLLNYNYVGLKLERVGVEGGIVVSVEFLFDLGCWNRSFLVRGVIRQRSLHICSLCNVKV